MVPSTTARGSHEVDIAAIERDLVRLLRQPENLSPSGQPGMRTAVLSLVVVAADRAMMERIEATLAALVDHHPSRTIVVLVSPEMISPQIGAWVQANCKPIGTSGINGCVDQIVIESNPAAIRRVPNVVLPLLLADLPAVLWWPGEPPLRDPLLYDLLEPVNCFVVDTSGFVHVERTLINLDLLRSRPGLRIDLRDLNWCRLLPWRELIAQFWDVPEWRARLNRLDRVEIDLGKPAGGRSNRAQGLLLAGWLSSRLGWKPLGMTRRRDGYRLEAGRGRRTIEMLIKIEPDQPSGVRAVRFVKVEPRTQLVFALRTATGGSADMSVAAEGSTELYQRTVRLESFDEAQLLARELDTTTADTVFEEALGAAATFVTATAAR